MGVKTVSFTYERKLNLGDYNSATIGSTIWLELDEGQTAEDGLSECVRLAKQTVKENAEPLFQKQTAAVKELFAGLPLELQGALRQQFAEEKNAD